MTPAQMAEVRASFALIAPRGEAFARTFYDELFMLDPSLRRLFPDNLAELRRKLSEMLSAIVRDLDQPAASAARYRMLGARHALYGVQESHYDLVGTALLKALHIALGHDYDAVEDAWATLYAELAEAMIAAGVPANA